MAESPHVICLAQIGKMGSRTGSLDVGTANWRQEKGFVSKCIKYATESCDDEVQDPQFEVICAVLGVRSGIARSQRAVECLQNLGLPHGSESLDQNPRTSSSLHKGGRGRRDSFEFVDNDNFRQLERSNSHLSTDEPEPLPVQINFRCRSVEDVQSVTSNDDNEKLNCVVAPEDESRSTNSHIARENAREEEIRVMTGRYCGIAYALLTLIILALFILLPTPFAAISWQNDNIRKFLWHDSEECLTRSEPDCVMIQDVWADASEPKGVLMSTLNVGRELVVWERLSVQEEEDGGRPGFCKDVGFTCVTRPRGWSRNVLADINATYDKAINRKLHVDSGFEEVDDELETLQGYVFWIIPLEADVVEARASWSNIVKHVNHETQDLAFTFMLVSAASHLMSVVSINFISNRLYGGVEASITIHTLPYKKTITEIVVHVTLIVLSIIIAVHAFLQLLVWLIPRCLRLFLRNVRSSRRLPTTRQRSFLTPQQSFWRLVLLLDDDEERDVNTVRRPRVRRPSTPNARWRKHMRNLRSPIWPVTDAGFVVCVSLAIYFQGLLYTIIQETVHDLRDSNKSLVDGFARIFRASHALRVHVLCGSLSLLLAIVRVYKYLARHDRLGEIPNTIMLAFWPLFHFFIVFLFTVVAFAVIAHFLFAMGDKDNFGRIDKSLISMFRLMVGELAYGDLLRAFGTSMRAVRMEVQIPIFIFYFSFFILVTILSLNILLAIIIESDEHIRRARQTSQRGVVDDLAKLGGRMGDRFSLIYDHSAEMVTRRCRTASSMLSSVRGSMLQSSENARQHWRDRMTFRLGRHFNTRPPDESEWKEGP